MQERTWQFRLLDDNHVDFTSYFEKRASEVALAMNCRIVASKLVRVDELGGNGRKVVGAVLLETVKGWPIPRTLRSSPETSRKGQ